MAKWEELPLADRAKYMRVAVQNGYKDIRSIREAYNIYAEGGKTNFTTEEEQLRNIAKTLPPDRVDTDGMPLGVNNNYTFPEAVVTAEAPYNYEKFLSSMPAETRAALTRQADFNLAAKRGPIITNADNNLVPGYSKEDIERERNAYFDVQSLNTAMGAPLTMNQTSYNYNPKVASDQLHYGSTMPLYSINEGIRNVALGEALRYGTNFLASKAKPLVFSKMLDNSVKNWDGTVSDAYFKDPYSWYRKVQSTEPIGLSEMGTSFTTNDIPKGASPTNDWRESLINAPIRVGDDGYYLEVGKKSRRKSRSFQIDKTGSAHGNVIQASSQMPWEGNIAASDLFKQGILEGTAPVNVLATPPSSFSRTDFRMYPWEELPAGNRIGFKSGTLPLEDLRYFEYIPRGENAGRYQYKGPVLPEHRINLYLNGGGKPNKKFNKWIKTIADMRDWDVNEMLNDPTYNYRHFFDSQPMEAEQMLHNNPDAHFTDIAKTAQHPTFSNESDYSGKISKYNPRGIIGGTWTDAPRLGENGSRYTFSDSQLKNNWDIGRELLII